MRTLVSRRKRWRATCRVDEFASQLRAYPYLGGVHDLGQEVGACNGAVRTSCSIGSDGSSGQANCALASTPVVACPQSEWCTFYLGGTQRAALRETVDVNGDDRVAWLQEFAIGEIDNILDLRVKDWSEELSPPLLAIGLTSEYISTTAASTAWNPGYLVPRFIADCARHAGYRSIIFHSAKHRDENLVLFSWDDLTVNPVGTPVLRLVDKDEEDDRWENPEF